MKKTYVKPNTNTTAINTAQLIMTSGSLSTPESDNAPTLKVTVEKNDNSLSGGTVTTGSSAKAYSGWDTFDED